MRTLLPMLGLSYLPFEYLVLLLVLMAVGGFFLGWLADAILADVGFGIALNGLILTAGAVAGFVLWNKAGYPVGGHNLHVTLLVAGISGGTLLACCGLGKRWV